MNKGKIYNFGESEKSRTRELSDLMSRHKGSYKLFISISVPKDRLFAFITEEAIKHTPLTDYGVSRTVQDANLNNTSARRDIGYNLIWMNERFQKCYSARY